MSSHMQVHWTRKGKETLLSVCLWWLQRLNKRAGTGRHFRHRSKHTHTHTRTKPGVHSNNAKRDASRSIYGNLWEWKCLNSIVPNGDRHSSPLLVRCGKSSTKQVTLPLAASAGSVRYWACPYGEQQSATFWRLAALVLLLTALPPARQPKPSAPAGGCRQTDNPGATTFLPRLMTHTPTSTSDIRRT